VLLALELLIVKMAIEMEAQEDLTLVMSMEVQHITGVALQIPALLSQPEMAILRKELMELKQ
jgi:hypothetical protein